MGLFSSKKKIFVASQALKLMEEIPNTLSNSVFKSVYQTRDIPLGMVDDLINGMNLNMKQVHRYGKSKYVNGVPDGRFVFTGINSSVIQNILNNLEGQPVTIKDIVLDSFRPEMGLEIYLYNTLGLKKDNTYITHPSLVINRRDAGIADIKAGTYFDKSTIEAENYSYNETSTENSTTTTTVTAVVTLTSAVITDETIEGTSNLISKSDGSVYISNTGYGDGDYYSGTTGTSRYELMHGYEFSYETTYTYDVVKTIVAVTTTTDTEGNVTTTTDTSTTTNSETLVKTEVIQGSVLEEYYNSFNEDAFYLATYTITLPDLTIKTKYWRYYESSNAYPELKFDRGTVEVDAFYPIIPLRYNNKNIGRESNQETDEYKTTKKILKKWGVDLDDVTADLSENPDIDDIDHAYIISGINLHSESRVGREYLFEFFKHLHTNSKYSKVEFDTWFNAYQSWVNSSENTWDALGWSTPQFLRNSFEITDSTLKIKILYNYIDIHTVSGLVKPGAVIGDIVTEDVIDDSRTYGSISLFGGAKMDYSKRIFKKQITATEYEVIEVSGLIHQNTIYGNKSVTTSIKDSATEDDYNFIIPLHIPTVKKLNIVKRDKLFYESMTMIVNSYEIVKVKWYQSGFFKAVIIFVALYFAQPQIAKFAAGLSAAAAGGAIAVISYLTPILLIGVAIQYVMKLAVKVLGEELALVFAVALMAFGLSNGKLFNFNIPFADKALMLGNGLINAVNTSIQEELEKLTNAFNELVEDYKGKFDALEEINKELNGLLKLDPMMFVGLEPLFIEGETSEQYFTRTKEVSNPGVLAIEAISQFTDIMLTLPEFKDTVGEQHNV